MKMNWLRQRLNRRRYNLYTEILLFAVSVIIFLCTNIRHEQFGDAGYYWEMGIRLLNGEGTLFRGYFYPGILGMLHILGGNTSVLYLLLTPVLYAIFFTDSFRAFWLCDSTIRNKKDIAITIFPYIIFMAFYWGLFSYAMSDFWAFAMAFLALIWMRRARANATSNNPAKVFTYSAMTGACAYLAYNIRTIYLFFIIGVLVYEIFLMIENISQKCHEKFVGQKCRAYRICGEAVGFSAAALPQFILNRIYKGTLSIAVPTEGIFNWQLSSGLMVQRRDAYVGDPGEIYPMFFFDSVGKHIVDAEGVGEYISVPDYVRLIIKYPFEMIGIYVRHFFNLLCPCWPEMFIKDLNRNRTILILAASCFLYLCLMIFITGSIRNKRLQAFCMLVLLPCAAIIPGGAEARFIMPFYIIAAGTMSFNTDWAKLRNIVMTHRAAVAAGYVFNTAILITLWTSMLAAYNDLTFITIE